MADAFELSFLLSLINHTVEPAYIVSYYSLVDIITCIQLYGPVSGLAVAIFGNKSMLRMQADVLSSLDDIDALEFRKIIQDESAMVGISGAIIAQIAITALTLPNLSQTHWLARGSWILSLVSALMAVYFAGRQAREMGRLFLGRLIRIWIRKGDTNTEATLSGDTPSSVLTVSAPGMLLSASLNFLLIGLGIYFGFTWTRGLDTSASPSDSRNVFIIFIVGQLVCSGVYTLSGIVQGKGPYWSIGGAMRNNTEILRQRLQQMEVDHINQDSQTKTRIDGGKRPIDLGTARAGDTMLDSTTSPLHNPGTSENQPGQTASIDSARHKGLQAIQQQLAQALNEAARLRREAAEAEDQVADIYERLASIST